MHNLQSTNRQLVDSFVMLGIRAIISPCADMAMDSNIIRIFKSKLYKKRIITAPNHVTSRDCNLE